MARKDRESRDPRAQQLLTEDEPLFTLKGMAGHLSSAGLTLLLGTAIMWQLKAQWTHWPLTVFAVAAVVLLALGFLGDRKSVLGFLFSRQTGQAANTFISVGLMFGIVVLLNVLAFRHDKIWDWTKEGSNTLDPQLINIIQKVKDPVEIRYFYGQRGLPKAATRLLDNASYYNRKLKISKINADLNPDAAQKDGVTAAGQTIVYNKAIERRERLNQLDESSLATALIKVQKGGQKRILFLKGHGERDLADTAPGGYAAAKKRLEDANHRVDSVSLIGKQVDALAECDLLVIGGPTTDLLEEESDVIREYLIKKQGAALIMLEPLGIKLEELPRPTTPNLYALVNRFGMEPQKGLLIETRETFAGVMAGAGKGAFFFAPVDPSRHAALNAIGRSGGVLIMMGLGMRAKTVTGADAPTTNNLIESSLASWSEASQAQLDSGEVKNDPEDPKGPLGIAMAAEINPGPDARSKKFTRVIVTGDSDFCSNAPTFGLDRGSNGLFFQAIVGWLVAEEGEAVTIVPKQPTPNQLGPFTAQDVTKIRYLSLLPGLLILAWGVSVWWRRR